MTLPVLAALARVPDSRLFGVEVPNPAPRWTPGAWVEERIQGFLTHAFESKIGLRGVLVRTDNTLFHATLGETKPEAVVKVGRGGVLFIDDDLGYSAKRDVDLPDPTTLDELASLAGETQRMLHAEGRRLVVVLAPSKTSLYPDAVPDSWRRGTSPRSDEIVYAELVAALRRHDVAFADGRAILSADPSERTLLFPVGARHWSAVGACRVLRAANADLAPDGCAYTWQRVDRSNPFVAELDLDRLLDTWHGGADQVSVPKLEPSSPTKDGRRVVFAGSSFSWALIAVARPFVGEVTCLYYDSTVYDATGPTPRVLGPVDVASPLWASRVASADVYVLEVFEGYAHAPYLRDFLRSLRSGL